MNPPGGVACRLAGILLLCAVAWSPALAQTDPWEAATRAGVEAFGKGELARGRAAFRTGAGAVGILRRRRSQKAVGNSNMGVLAYELGAFAEAEKFHGRALEQRLKLYGGMHPAVAESLSLMGLAIREQGRFAEAAVAFGDALVITRTLSGLDNPEVADRPFPAGRRADDAGQSGRGRAALPG